MKNILSKQSQRFLTTLEHLYYNNFSTYENLALLSHASIKTIQDDIKKINDFISPLQITEHSHHVCYLDQKNNIASDFIYSRILYNSLEYSVLELIFFEKENRLEDYADSLFISLSTLKRIISKINSRVKGKGFQITTNPIQIVGDERLICNTMYNFFKEKYLENNYPFSDIQYKVFDQLMYRALDKYKEFLNYPDISKIKLFSFISLIRMQNGHFYEINYEKDLKKDYQFPFLDNHLLNQAFKSVFHLELNRENIIDLAYPFLNENFAFSYEEAIEISKNSVKKNKELDNIIHLLNDISNSLNIYLEKNKREKLILDLFNVRLLMVGKNYLINNVKHNFLLNLMADYPVVYKFISDKIINNPLFDEYQEYEKEDLIYILVTHWNDLLFTIQDFQPVYTVGLCMTADVEHTEMISKMLNRKFYKRFDFQPIYFTKFNEISKKINKYDIILTNISNLTYDDKIIVSIDLYPSLKDYTKLYNLYYEIQG